MSSQQVLLTCASTGGAGTSGRYWRIRVTDNNGAAFYAVDDIRFWLNGVEYDRTGKTYTGSPAAFGTYTPARAFDGLGDPYAATASSNAPAFWQIDFGSEIEVDEIWVGRSSAMSLNECPKDFTLDYSSDDISWLSWQTLTGVTSWPSGGYNVYP